MKFRVSMARHLRRSTRATALVPLALAAMAVAPGRATAQDGGGRGSTSLSASVDTQLSYVVNSRTGGLSGGEFVAEVRPGLQLSSRSGRIVGSLNYALGLSYHSRNNDGENVQHQLNGSFSAEAIERWMYVDGSASVSQQTVSAFGQQSAIGSTQDNPNRIEVATVSLSPYVRGVFGSAVNYEARYTVNATNGRRSIAADSSGTTGSLSLSSAIGGTALGWGLLGSTQTSSFRAGRETKNDRYSASLSYAPDVDLSFSLRGGQESTDIASASKTTYNNWGVGATWRPTPRTRAQFDTDDRYFGRSYRVLLEHRLASSAVQFSSSRDSSNGSDPSGAGQRVTLYQVFFAQFASIQPDPVLRDLLVLDFLRAQNLDPNIEVSGGFLNTAVTVQQRHQLTVSYAGLRMAASAQAFASNSRVVDAAAATPANQDTRQWGYLANASYRLTPDASLALTGSRLVTQATATQGSTNLKSLSLSLSSQLARRTSASFSVRYSVFTSATDPYREAGITASLSQRF